MARIHPSWHRRFLLELGELLRRYGFALLRHDGDQLLFLQEEPPRVSSQEEATAVVGELLRGLQTFLVNCAENLLDYTVLLEADVKDRAGAAGAFPLFVQRLSSVRQENTLYLTEEAAEYFHALLEMTREGALFRVISLSRDDHDRPGPYDRVLRQGCSQPALDLIVETLSREGKHRGFWFHGPDRSAVATLVGTILERDGSGPAVLIQCSRAMTRRDFLRRVIQAIPDTPVPESERSEEDRVYTALREQLKEPCRGYLARNMVDCDLQGTAAFLVRRFFLSDSQRRVYLADCDLCEGAAREFLSWIPETTSLAPLVVSSAAPPPEGSQELWTVTDLSPQGDSPSPPPASLLTTASEARNRGEFSRALRYWVNCFGPGRSLGAIFHRGLKPQYRRVLFLVFLADGRGGLSFLDDLCRGAGLSPVEQSHALRELVQVGLLSSLNPPRVHEAVARTADTILESRGRKKLEQQVSNHLAERVMAESLPLTPELWELLRSGLSRKDQIPLLHLLLQRIAEGGGEDELEGLARDLPREMKTSLDSAELRLALRWTKGPGACPDLAERLSLGNDRAPSPWESDFILALAEYELARRDYVKALKLCKTALLLNLEGAEHGHGRVSAAPGGRSCRGNAHLLMARIALYQGQVREAAQYLSFARDEGEGDALVFCEARSLEGVHCFLLGNYTRADRIFGEVQPRLFEAGATHQLLLSWFARARIRFELGEYTEARAGFAFLERYSGERGIPPIQNVARAWKRRATFFLSDSSGEDPEEGDPRAEDLSREEVFFLAEALCRRGHFDRALPLLEDICAAEEGTDRWPRLGVAWENGFAPLEDLLVASSSGVSELGRLATACRAWALAKTGRMDEAVPLFFGLTRGGNGAAQDPQALLFTYLYSTVLPEKRSPDQDDRATVLGRAVKLCQERSSRIEGYQDRMRFTRDNLWTRELLEAARRYNLV
ncbi:tetratricopeptide repeat protein [Alkalispirochaeta americana]|nr:hypothetical protein [Alkalispirochaeta americana]